MTEPNWTICLDCNGTGKEQIPCGPEDLTCEFCGGSGRIDANSMPRSRSGSESTPTELSVTHGEPLDSHEAVV